MRAFSTTLLAALIIAALFWGNCLSCPQLLLSLAQTGAAHGCCKRSAPVAKCDSYRLKSFVKADPVVVAPPAVAVAAALVQTTLAAPLSEIHLPFLVPYSPPELQALISTFRI